MSSVTSIASSGLRAVQLQMDAAAHNVANQATPGFRRLAVAQQAQEPQAGVQAQTQRNPEPGAALEADMVGQRMATYGFAANLLVLRTQDRMQGTLLDTRA